METAASIEQINCFSTTTNSVSATSTVPQNGWTTSNTTWNTLGALNGGSSGNTAIYERHVKLLAKVLQTMANMTECKEPFMQPLSEFLNQNKSRIVKFIDEIASPQDDIEFNSSNSSSSSSRTSSSSASSSLSTSPAPLHLANPNDSPTSKNPSDAYDFGNRQLEAERQLLCGDDETRLNIKYAECKYLAILHRLLSAHVPQMRAHLKACVKNNDENDEIEFADSLRTLVDILEDINRHVKC